MALHVFVSHSSKDRAWVEWIRGQADPGVLLYLAEHDAQPGMSLSKKVTDQIDSSDAVLVFLTEHSRATAFVHQEIGYALKANKLVVPVVQPGLAPEVFAMLAGVEYIPFDFDAPQEGGAALLSHLKTIAAARERDQQRDELATALLLVAGLLLVAALTSSSLPAV